MALTLSMSIEDIKKKIKDEVPIQVIADLNGLDIKTFENALRQYEKDTGEKILPERKRGRPRTDNPGRSTQYRRAKEARETKPAPSRILEDFSTAKQVKDPEKIMIDEKTMSCLNEHIYALEEQLNKLNAEIKTASEMLCSWIQIRELCKTKEDKNGVN